MKTDLWIKERCINNNMITPFIDHSVKKIEERKCMSFGLSCAGYDLRLTDKVYHLKDTKHCIDPKKLTLENDYDEYQVRYDDEGAKYVWIEPGISLASTIEYVKMPRDATALMKIKSSYSRVGVTILDPLIEPEWEGNVTVAIVNNTHHSVKLYLGEGMGQIVFFGTEGEVGTSYEDKGGKYQGTKGVAVTRM